MPTPTNRIPVVFIPGLWLPASAWAPWAELFAERGYRPLAPSGPGGAVGVEAVVAHFAGIIGALDSPPILVGHAFGGMVAQRLLRQDRARAVVVFDAAPVRGLLPAPLPALGATLATLRDPARRGRAVPLSAAQFRFAFGTEIPAAEAQALFERWAVPVPGRLLFEVAAVGFDPPVPAETCSPAPLLLITGGEEHRVPEAVVRAALQQDRCPQAVTDIIAFADRGHSLTIDHGWREVAETVLAWLHRNR